MKERKYTTKPAGYRRWLFFVDDVAENFVLRPSEEQDGRLYFTPPARPPWWVIAFEGLARQNDEWHWDENRAQLWRKV